jgi:hypothetical protein
MKNSSKSKKTDKQETRRLCNASQKFNLVRHELSYYKTYPMIKIFFEPALLQNNQRQKDKKTVSLLVLMRCVCVCKDLDMSRLLKDMIINEPIRHNLFEKM